MHDRDRMADFGWQQPWSSPMPPHTWNVKPDHDSLAIRCRYLHSMPLHTWGIRPDVEAASRYRMQLHPTAYTTLRG